MVLIDEGKSSDGGADCNQAVNDAKNEALTNGYMCGVMDVSADPSSGESKDLRTYKRRRKGNVISESKFLEYGRIYVKAARHLAGQESDACDFSRGECHLEEGKLHNRTKLRDIFRKGVSRNGSPGEVKCGTAAAMCQHILFDILASKEFASLNELLSENFQGIRIENLSSMGFMLSRMKEGVYEHSPILFSTDVQEVWKKFQFIGNEMISLAESLLDLSATSCAEQFCAQKSKSHTKPGSLAANSAYQICTCNQCGQKADEKDCLVCDHCEDMYHVSCTQPAFKEIPKKSWYCLNCTSRGIGPAHENCVACERLNLPRTPMNNTHVKISTACEQNSNDVEEDSEGKTDSEMCRVCGNQIENSGKFITCDHPFCPHKYYHVRCLTMKQLKVYGPLWYCPSCLCRDCLMDKDDNKIVLCDGCDCAYHIYCMKPPLTSVPEGKWFCRDCEAAIQRIRRAKRAYENMKKL